MLYCICYATAVITNENRIVLAHLESMILVFDMTSLK